MMKCTKETKFLKDHIIICKPKFVMDEYGMEEMQDVVEAIDVENTKEKSPLRELIDEIEKMPVDELTKKLKEAGVKFIKNPKYKKKK